MPATAASAADGEGTGAARRCRDEQENHFLPRTVIAALMREAARNGGRLDWVNCGLCVDERGAAEAIDGARRGTPADFWKMAEGARNTLVIATRD